MQDFSTKIKEQVDYPGLLFRHIDRTLEIGSAPYLNYEQFGRSVDLLAAATCFIEDDRVKKKDEPNGKLKAPPKNLSEKDYYERALEFIRDVVKRLESKGMLTKRTMVGMVSGSLGSLVENE